MKRPFTSLVKLYIKQLVHSKTLWIIGIIIAGMFIMNYFVRSNMDEILGSGASYDIASRKATSLLNNIAGTIRSYAAVIIVIVSALVAPQSRKNGTTQFVLSLSIGRYRLAFAQFCALALFIVLSIFILHIGFVACAGQYGVLNLSEIAFSWVYLLLPLLLYAVIVFVFSLSFSAIETYIVFLAIPAVGFSLLHYVAGELAGSIPLMLVRVIDNLSLLYPDFDSIIIWPRVAMEIHSKEPPFLDWTWQYIHILFSSAFWISLGLWCYRRYDFGSRTAIK